jgi:hypothetical protein
MGNNNDIYIKKAKEAVEYVYKNEYHNSLGIPMPQITMLLPDDPKYSTGEYYISINRTWQIHLNFGKLPVSFKEFQDEVKVLTRHEIEHYMCCPFDVITHLRMLKRIIGIYKKDYSHLNLNIDKLCGYLSNQASDIIVDTVNFMRHPQETLISEINWIKKGADLSICPRHSKLMCLTKEAIWRQSLEINETDTELLDIVHALADKFLENGINDKASFLDKAEEYTKVFFRLYIQDKNQQSNQNQNTNQSQGNQNNQGNQSQTGQQGHSQGNNLQSQPQGNQQSVRHPNQAGKPKDGSENGSAFVFADPDKVKEAIEIFAQESNLQEFVEILSISGIGGMAKAAMEKLWFCLQSAEMIPIEEYTNKGNKDNYSYPAPWKIGDSIEDIDLMLSFMTSPIILPGITTKKWEMTTNNQQGIEKNPRDLLLVLDISSSMGGVTDESSNMHHGVLAAYGILSYFESINGQVALIEFNNRVMVNTGWTKQYDDLRDKLIVSGDGGTVFPIREVINVLDKSKNEIVTVLITDGDLGNINQSMDYFRGYLNDDNKLYVFILGKSRSIKTYENLKNIGAKIYQANDARDFCDMVISDIS